MRQVREVLRLKLGLGLKDREIARSCSIPHSSVANYVARAKAAGLGWPLPPDLSDDAIERLLFPPECLAVERPVLPQPDFAAMHREIRRHRYVTLPLLPLDGVALPRPAPGATRPRFKPILVRRPVETLSVPV